MTCETCKGTGFNPEEICIPAWIKAKNEFTKKHEGSCGIQDSAGNSIGRKALKGSAVLLVKSFTHKKVKEKGNK